MHPDSSFPAAPPVSADPLVVSSSEVIKAVYSFPAGSAAGPDGLRSQHLKDLVTYARSEGSDDLIASLTNFVNYIIAGNVPRNARLFFFGASLTGLSKKDGGIRPIAVGCTLRRLAAKCLCASVFDEMGSILYPMQLGFGTSIGAEAAVHAARSYLANMKDDQLLLKLDFTNAFNSVRRDKILHSVREKAPALLPLAYSAYRFPSLLFFGKHTIPSAEGVQQGDPLGPLLFCLAIHDIIVKMKSEFTVFYLDDGTLGGSLEDVKSDLSYLERAASSINLFLNHNKSEVICVEDSTKTDMLSCYPSLRPTEPTHATLLGSPIGGMESITDVWESKIEQLKILGSRLEQLQAHDALCLLRNAFALPKVLYVLRTAPSFLSPLLDTFDDVQKSLLEAICNIHLSDKCWLQASIPINAGGIGIRSVSRLAPSAFLASAAGTSSITSALLPPRFSCVVCPHTEKALSMWKRFSGSADPPSGRCAVIQKEWDKQVVAHTFSCLLSNADPTSKARLQAAHQKESGAWISAPPISALGLRMDNDCIRVAVGLRLGSSLCLPHLCPHCGSNVDESGIHALSCRKSKGRLPRHSSLNDIIKRALVAVSVPCTLESRGLCRSDGRWPDGISIIPWSRGRCLAWDATCHDTYAPSNIQLACSGPGLVADRAASAKRRLYEDICTTHDFTPIAIESAGSFGKDALSFFHELARRTRAQSKDPLSYLKICQRISVCMQRFNTYSILACCSI